MKSKPSDVAPRRNPEPAENPIARGDDATAPSGETPRQFYTASLLGFFTNLLPQSRVRTDRNRDDRRFDA
jgi:hypothetical protein